VTLSIVDLHKTEHLTFGSLEYKRKVKRSFSFHVLFSSEMVDHTSDHVKIDSPSDEAGQESEPWGTNKDVQDGISNSNCREYLEQNLSQSCFRARKAEQTSDWEEWKDVFQIVLVGPEIFTRKVSITAY